jgi:hypothetical protein
MAKKSGLERTSLLGDMIPDFIFEILQKPRYRPHRTGRKGAEGKTQVFHVFPQ